MNGCMQTYFGQITNVYESYAVVDDVYYLSHQIIPKVPNIYNNNMTNSYGGVGMAVVKQKMGNKKMQGIFNKSSNVDLDPENQGKSKLLEVCFHWKLYFSNLKLKKSSLTLRFRYSIENIFFLF